MSKGKYGEPWLDIDGHRKIYTINTHCDDEGIDDCWVLLTHHERSRALACVNALDGIPDDALEKIQRGEWRIVPKEPTEEIAQAGVEADASMARLPDITKFDMKIYMRKLYRAMTAAAPKVTK